MSAGARLLGLALLALALAVCPAAHEPYPSLSCKTDNDCFSMEKCVNTFCVAITPDLSVVLPPADMSSISDGAPADGGS
jgi:hypothetical protein